MSDLTTFRDHCRRMAHATPTMPVLVDGKLLSSTPAERRFWAGMADEIDRWLEPSHDDVDQLELGVDA